MQLSSIGSGLCLAFLLVVLGVNLWQYLAARRFPLHQRPGISKEPLPSVTLLKPLKGCDTHTLANLESWVCQQYPTPVQFLFAVRDPQDPVCELVRGLQSTYPKVSIQLVFCRELLGANAKVSSLAHLEPLIQGDWVVVSDADVRVAPGFLESFAAVQLQTGAGLVNCFYRLANPTTPAMQWEAVAMNADFWSQVLQSRALWPQDFALGAVMGLSRETLQKIGGFRALVNHLADDYHLGNRVARLGLKVELAPMVVDCWEPPADWGQVWAHQLRWARTIRVCQPLPYFASILSNVSLWCCIALVATRGGTSPGALSTAMTMTAVLGLLWRAYSAIRLQSLFERTPLRLAQLWVPWLKDALGFFVWLAAFGGAHVVWRGIRYRVNPDGTLVPMPLGDTADAA